MRRLVLWTIVSIIALAVPALGQLSILAFAGPQSSQQLQALFLSLCVAECGAIFLATSVFKQWRDALKEERRGTSELAQSTGPTLKLAGSLADPPTQVAERANELGERLSEANKLTSSLEEQLQEQRKTMRELIDKAVDVICIVNARGEIVSINNACETSWGYKQADLVGKSLYGLLEEGKAGEVMPAALGAMYSVNKIVFESRVRKCDGGALDVILTGHWSATESGFFCIIHDITEQREFERLKNEFTAMVAHDIRTPLASVLTFLELTEKGVLGGMNEQGQKLVGLTRAKCEGLMRLLNDMLQLDKIEAGSFELQLGDVDMAAVVRDCIETVGPTAQSKSLKLEALGPSVICWADELRLTQVLLNLLTNAAKYAPERSTVRVSIEEQNGNVIVSVADQGKGIAQEKLARIFEPFEQASLDDARQKQGIGLGLAICKAIVGQHGGKIGVESTPGLGSRFWFSIPKTK